MSSSVGVRPAPRPPRIARALLWALVRASAREILAGDLEEEFRVDVASVGVRTARWRFWRMTLASIGVRWRAATAFPGPRQRGDNTVRTFIQDLRFGLRQAQREPLVPLAAVLTLALGIAASTTVFGMLNALVIRPLPYADAGRVTFVLGTEASSGDLRFNLSYSDAVDLANADIFEDLATYRALHATLSSGDVPERVQAYRVSPNTFNLLGVPAALGRTFSPADAAVTGTLPVVLGHGLWARRFGADPAVVGQELVINGIGHRVVGVMPPSFEFPVFNFKGDLWVPLEPTPDWTPANRAGSPSVVVVGRLASTTSVSSAQSAVDVVMQRLAGEHPGSNGDLAARVVPMGQLGAEQFGPALGLLAVGGGLVLLVACANVASLLLSRGVTRSREFAMRLALGARRGRLIRQLLAECALLAAVGGGLAVLLSWWALEAVRSVMPDFLRQVLPGVEALRLDGTVLLFVAAAAGSTVLIFGLFPAWQSADARATMALRGGGRLASGAGGWLRTGLVIGEVAMSVALLATTMLLSRSVGNLLTADPGFEKSGLLSFSVALPRLAYPEGADRVRFYGALTDRLGALPGVEGVGLVNTLPFSTSDEATDIEVIGRERPTASLDEAGLRLVTDGYFAALGAPLVSGRLFVAADAAADAPIAVVNETFARRYLESNAIGREVRLPGLGTEAPRLVVVGVVGDVLHWALGDGPRPELYLPYRQAPRQQMTVAVRTAGDPDATMRDVRATLADLDPLVPAYDVTTMSRLIENSFLAQTLSASVLRVFGGGALALAAVGLYGVLAFSVGQRRREIGVRLAIGAEAGDVMRLVFRQALRIVGVGLAIGLLAAWAAAGALSSLLYGVTRLDPASYAATAAALTLVAAVATLQPLRRALRVDPVIALRED